MMSVLLSVMGVEARAKVQLPRLWFSLLKLRRKVVKENSDSLIFKQRWLIKMQAQGMTARFTFLP